MRADAQAQAEAHDAAQELAADARRRQAPRRVPTTTDLEQTREELNRDGDKLLHAFCNPNPRSAMGFVGTPWETGSRFSLETPQILWLLVTNQRSFGLDGQAIPPA